MQIRSLEILPTCVVNLPAKFFDIKESQQFANLISKHSENKRLTCFLKEVGSSEDQVFNPGSCRITGQPRKCGLWLKNEEWVISMKMRLNIPVPMGHAGQKCRCGIDASLDHVLNCNRFNKLRDFPQNMVRDNLWNMFVSNGVSSETEVPLKDICASIRTLERMDLSSTFAESYDAKV
ncbi:hypothetical protein RCL1_001049 [Eukaryota sp. TZLM3-RCL]